MPRSNVVVAVSFLILVGVFAVNGLRNRVVNNSTSEFSAPRLNRGLNRASQQTPNNLSRLDGQAFTAREMNAIKANSVTTEPQNTNAKQQIEKGSSVEPGQARPVLVDHEKATPEEFQEFLVEGKKLGVDEAHVRQLLDQYGPTKLKAFVAEIHTRPVHDSNEDAPLPVSLSENVYQKTREEMQNNPELQDEQTYREAQAARFQDYLNKVHAEEARQRAAFSAK